MKLTSTNCNELLWNSKVYFLYLKESSCINARSRIRPNLCKLRFLSCCLTFFCIHVVKTVVKRSDMEFCLNILKVLPYYYILPNSSIGWASSYFAFFLIKKRHENFREFELHRRQYHRNRVSSQCARVSLVEQDKNENVS